MGILSFTPIATGNDALSAAKNIYSPENLRFENVAQQCDGITVSGR